MGDRPALTPIQARVWLVFLRSSQCVRLTFNVVREVCLYLGRDFLPCISNRTLCLYDLETHTFQNKHLEHFSFDRSWVFCWIDTQTLLGVSNQNSVEIDSNTDVVPRFVDLRVSRGRPGLACAENWAYAFGGNVAHPLHSSEKYHLSHKVWEPISAKMKSPKSCFTPCRFAYEFYLCCLTGNSQPFEAFFLPTETFRNLPVGYSSSLFGSVTFATEETLYILGAENVLLKWQLHKSELECVQMAELMGIRDSASSSVLPMRVRRKVGWVCYSNARPVVFDLDTELLCWGL